MGESETKATSNNDTTYVFWIDWKGHRVQMVQEDSDILPLCKDGEHRVIVMHHYGEDGFHYCPTQFLYCPDCFAIGEEPEPYECTKWKEA